VTPGSSSLLATFFVKQLSGFFLLKTIVCQALFSTILHEEVDAIDGAFTLVNRHIAQHAFSPGLSLNLPTPSNRRFKAAVRTLDSIVNTIIRQR